MNEETLKEVRSVDVEGVAARVIRVGNRYEVEKIYGDQMVRERIDSASTAEQAITEAQEWIRNFRVLKG